MVKYALSAHFTRRPPHAGKHYLRLSPVFDVLLPDGTLFFLNIRRALTFENTGIERDAAGIAGN